MAQELKAKKNTTKVKKILKIKDKYLINYSYFALNKNILFIEDDPDMRELIAGHLEYIGFNVSTAKDGIEGQALAIRNSPDLILINLMLPKLDGLNVCERLRRDDRTYGIPILMMEALGGLDEITGFNSRADDYITIPFDLDELHVRIKALLRRTNRAVLNSTNQQEILNYGPLTLVPESFEVIWFNSPVRLRCLEFEPLCFGN